MEHVEANSPVQSRANQAANMEDVVWISKIVEVPFEESFWEPQSVKDSTSSVYTSANRYAVEIHCIEILRIHEIAHMD